MSQEVVTSSVPAATTESLPLPDDELFVMKKHFSACDIKLAARSEIGRKQLVAFVGGDGALSLHFLPGEPPDKPVMKLIPWFADPSKRITCMCFDPSGVWLLIAGYDNSLFIVPALALVDKSSHVDHRWSTDDITIFPPIAGAQGSAGRGAHPSSIVWWQSLMDCTHTAVVASDRGDIAFINLASGSQVGVTFIRSPIISLHLCQDNSMDTVFLMITNESRDQFRLLLEQRSSGFSWPGDSGASTSELSSSTGSADLDFNSKIPPTTRSRLQGLKQLSVEKLAILRQRLAETRSRGVMMGMGGSSAKRGLSALLKESETISNGSGSSSGSDDTGSGNRRSSTPTASFTSTGPAPERLSIHVGDTFLQPQHARGRHLLSGYYAPSSILTVHGASLEVVPLFVHKLPPNCGEVLLTDRFLFIPDATGSTLSIVSCQLSECRIDGETDFNPDALITSFTFPNEKVLSIFKCTESNYRREEQKPVLNETETSSKETARGALKTMHVQQQQQQQSREFKPTPIEAPPVDSCVVVTSHGMYTIRLKTPAPDVFLELVLQHQALERAERLALVFGLSLQQLLEHAGDLCLASRDFPNAIAFYKLSRCRHLKSVLKFAAGGHPAELLSYVNLLSTSTSGLVLSASEKIHLSNLAVMSYTEQVLRNPHARTMFKNFLRFLRENVFYDEVLAVNVAGQTGLWEVLQYLCSARGMHIHVLEVLSKVLRSGSADSKLPEGPASRLAPTADAGMWHCASDPSLQQALLIRPPLARCHLQAVTTHLATIEQQSLERLAALYDPSAPAARPFLQKRLGRIRTTSESGSCCSSSTDPTDFLLDANVNEDAVFPLDQLLHTFLLVLLQLAVRKVPGPSYDPRLVRRPSSPSLLKKQESPPSTKVPVQHSTLSAGYAHVALIRNSSVYTWGGAVLGCLGTGPTMSRYATPQPIGLFPSLLVEVTSVACGRQHTLALSNNGVYAWGSSQFGQLGIGSVSQVPSPRLVESLASEHVVAITAGQYHSLALTEDGRLFSWGWGVHGQLGHRSVEDEHLPKLVERLTEQAMVQVSGGHGHSLVLAADGTVFTFGSNVFGQLGNGSSAKSTIPVRVAALPEPCVLIATGYFHNLAVSSSNKLYTWGSSPQVLRLQAQAQKKARLLQQQSMQAAAAAAAAAAAVAAATAAAASAATTDTSETSSQSSVCDESPPIPDIFNTDPLSSGSLSASTSTFPLHSDSANDNQTKPGNGGGITHNCPTSNSNGTIHAETRQALKARLTLDNIGESPRKSTEAATTNHSFGLSESLSSKVSTTPEVLFDEEFPEVAKLEAEELVAPGLPAIVVSPTVEFKGLSPPSVPTNSTSPGGTGVSGSAAAGETDEGQAHLLPQQVDLALVVGTVAQIACGCHHSALLSSEGTLYVWGRNLDGQVGNGSRKEVPSPAPLGCTPTVSLKQATAVGGLSNVIPGTVLDRTCLQQVCCGCEYTLALEATGSGRVWAWGSNVFAQLGFPPVEDSKPLEGKLVMLKTSKRVIKLPHGMHNSCDLPREIAGLPAPAFSYAASDPQIKTGSEGCAEAAKPSSLSKLEDPPYGLLTLHVALQRFHGLFDAKQLMAKCVELENYQAAARLAALDRRYHVALAFQLRALASCTNGGAGASSHNGHGEDDDVHLKNDRNANRSNLNGARKNNKYRREQLITDAGETPTAKQEKEIAMEEHEPIRVVRLPAGSSCSSADVSPRKHIRGRPLAEQGRSASASSTPDSTRSSVVGDDAEMHTFSIQGGREQMSEGGRNLASPDSGLSQPIESPAHQRPSLDLPVSSTDTNKPTENTSGLPDAGAVNIDPSSSSDPSSQVHHESGGKEKDGSVATDTASLIISSTVPEERKKEEREENITSEKIPLGYDLVQEASSLVEYYVSLMEEDSHTMMSQLLQQGFEFWLSHALPVEHLESLLLRHLPKFCYSLGLLLFCKGSDVSGEGGEQQNSEPALLHQLSTRFCLQLCSVLLGHINQRKPHPEYMEALARAAAVQGLNGCSGSLGSSSTPEHQLEVLLTGLRGLRAAGTGATSQPYITLTQEDLRGCGLSNSERLLVFSCGHHYGSDTFEQTVLPELESALNQLAVPLPGTARLLKGAFRGGAPTLQLACPRCVISHIQAQVLA